MLIVGLSGGIASGKSTAAHQFVAQGLEVIDCDQLAHDCTARGRWGYRRVVAAFGREMLDPTTGTRACMHGTYRRSSCICWPMLLQ